MTSIVLVQMNEILRVDSIPLPRTKINTSGAAFCREFRNLFFFSRIHFGFVSSCFAGFRFCFRFIAAAAVTFSPIKRLFAVLLV